MFHRKVDDSSTNLNSFVEAGKQWRALLDKNEGAKLALVVFQEELAFLELDLGVAAAH